jgi:hypothetical protein
MIFAGQSDTERGSSAASILSRKTAAHYQSTGAFPFGSK